MIQLYSTCWAANAPAGPRSAGTKNVSSATSGLVSWAVRHAEIELTMYDRLPATRPWLLEAAFQAKTSSVMVFSYSRFMYSSASMVSGELSTTRSFSSWTEAPNDHMSARSTMLESISWDMP